MKTLLPHQNVLTILESTSVQNCSVLSTLASYTQKHVSEPGHLWAISHKCQRLNPEQLWPFERAGIHHGTFCMPSISLISERQPLTTNSKTTFPCTIFPKEKECHNWRKQREQLCVCALSGDCACCWHCETNTRSICLKRITNNFKKKNLAKELTSQRATATFLIINQFDSGKVSSKVNWLARTHFPLCIFADSLDYILFQLVQSRLLGDAPV